jgi:hypothetical protein
MTTRFANWHDLPYGEIWVIDAEWYPGSGLAHGGRDGDPITPLCLAASELRSGRTVQLWQDELGPFPPYGLGDDVLLTSYMWTADGGVFHRALRWGRAKNAVCSYIEFRHLTNDARIKSGDRPQGFYSLAGAARYFKVSEIDLAHKDDMRERILQGPPFAVEERRTIQAYNLDDARVLTEVFKRLVPTIPSWPHALMRGECCWAFSGHEHRGVPLAPSSYDRIQHHWPDVDLALVRSVDRNYGVYDVVAGVPHFRNDSSTTATAVVMASLGREIARAVNSTCAARFSETWL